MHERPRRIASCRGSDQLRQIHQQRIDTWPQQYPWVDVEGLQYFRNRLTQARRDVAHGLRFTLDYFSRTRALQERAVEILQFKLDVLWSMLDAVERAYPDDLPEDRRP